MATFDLCHDCAAAVTNDDYSAFDLRECNYSTEEEFQSFLSGIHDRVKAMGNVTIYDNENGGGYFDCYVCRARNVESGCVATAIN